MKHLDLFSGIGGFALATEMVWDDVEHIFCDNDLFCQAILKKHWPKALIYGDIRTLTANTDVVYGETGSHEEKTKQWKKSSFPFLGRCNQQIDLLTGGFPCQPFSQAGRRRGTEDDRHLWPEMLRVIQEFHPRWIIGENVGGIITWERGLVLEQIFTDLEGAGYEVQAFVVPAAAVNAPHRRDRVWIVANTSSGRFDKSKERKSEQPRRAEAIRTNSDTSYSESTRGPKLNQKQATGQRAGFDREGSKKRWTWNDNWIEVATHLCRMDDGISKRLDRAPRLKALGNAIVPQIAAEIMRAIASSSHTT